MAASRTVTRLGGLIDAPSTWLFLTWALLIARVVRAIAMPLEVNPDASIYLECGRRLIEGQVPYVDFFDVNPPMAFYVAAIPAWLSSVSGLHIITIFVGLTLVAIIWSVLSVRRHLALIYGSADSPAVALGGFLWALFSVAIVRSIGQREHMFVLLAVPFVLMRINRQAGRDLRLWSAVSLGGATAIVACLKPFFVVTLLAPEVYWLTSRGGWRNLVRPEMVALTSTGMGYAAHFLVMPSAARQSFFGRWLPIVMKGYGAYDAPAVRLAVPSIILALAGVALYGLVEKIGTHEDKRVARPFALFALLALSMYLVQRKGWPYHAIPTLAAMVILAAICGRALFAGLGPGERSARGALGPGLLLLSGVAAGIGAQLRSPFSPEAAAFRAALSKYSSAGDPVLVIDSSVGPAFPALVQMDRHPVARVAVGATILPLLYYGIERRGGAEFPYRTVMTDDEAWYVKGLSEDLARNTPRLVMMNAGSCQACPDGFSIAGYLEAIGFLRAQMARYHEVAAQGAFRLFVREGEEPPH